MALRRPERVTRVESTIFHAARNPAMDAGFGLQSVLQYAQDGEDCVPVPRGCRCLIQLVDLAQVADGLHVTAVHPEYKLAFASYQPHQPPAVCGEAEWEGFRDRAGLGQDAHESNPIRGTAMGCERVVRFQAQQQAPFTENDLGFEWKPPQQGGTELRARPRPANNQSAGRAYVDHIVLTELPGQKAGAKGSMPANVDPAEKDNQSHARIMTKKSVGNQIFWSG